MRIRGHERFKNIYWAEFEGKKRLATVNFAPGNSVYDEKLIEYQGTEYRTWDPYRSKLAASVLRGIENVPIGARSRVLYLGAASGTTASHVSDIAGAGGMVICVEISSRSLRDLLTVCEKRPNMVPILADATKVEEYRAMVVEADVIYQDIAHPEQTDIMIENSHSYLREGGYAMLALKARSIDVTKEARKVFKEEMKRLEEEFEIVDSKILDPYEKDHAMLVLHK